MGTHLLGTGFGVVIGRALNSTHGRERSQMTQDLIADRYRVVRAVGRGGMGTVWLCQDEVLRREVAAKRIGALPGESAASTARAMREARSAAAINHENAVAIYDITEHDEAPWLIMEYVPSRTLAEVVDEDGSLPVDRVAGIGAQLAAVMAVAHSLGIMHRDIKPGNVLVGADDLAKISDFGIARAAHDEQLTQTGMVTGTPGYFSPELAVGKDPSAESDVWALGATLYTALEGRPPHEHQANPLAMLQTIAAEPPRPPQHAGAMTGLLGRMMDRDPASRTSMAQAETELRVIAGRSVDRGQTHDDVMAGESERPADREDGHVIAWLDSGPPQPDDESASAAGLTATWVADPPRTEPSRGRRWPGMVTIAAVLVAGVVGYLLYTNLGGDTGTTGASSTGGDSTGKGGNPSQPAGPRASQRSSPSDNAPHAQRPGSGGASSSRGADRAQVNSVRSYFAGMPDDTDTGWTSLAPQMQADGRAAYEDFWGSISSVKTSNITPLAGSSAVRLQITYTFTDGRVVTETQQLALQSSGSDWLIADDQVISSTTVSN